MKCKTCQRVEMKVSQYLADKNSLKLICPKCGLEELVNIDELRAEAES